MQVKLCINNSYIFPYSSTFTPSPYKPRSNTYIYPQHDLLTCMLTIDNMSNVHYVGLIYSPNSIQTKKNDHTLLYLLATKFGYQDQSLKSFH
jgi:hypothetical protein